MVHFLPSEIECNCKKLISLKTYVLLSKKPRYTTHVLEKVNTLQISLVCVFKLANLAYGKLRLICSIRCLLVLSFYIAINRSTWNIMISGQKFIYTSKFSLSELRIICQKVIGSLVQCYLFEILFSS